MVKVTFIHPDLGIGGAERLIVDAALALKAKGHQVSLFTAHHDPKHCFKETRDGTLQVTCAGDWLPRQCFHKGYAFFAYLRMVYVAFYLVLFSKTNSDVIVCDQISACIPVLKLSRAKILFYCHFPDQLLTDRRSLLKRMYRWPIDKLEEVTTGMADEILVNSKFTRSIFHATFKSLRHIIQPTVHHPSLNFAAFDRVPAEIRDSLIPKEVEFIFLSINRVERKKNLPLAIHAFATLLEMLEQSEWGKVHLILAGGCDERVVENKQHFQELVDCVDAYKLGDRITFVRSFTDEEKVSLLNESAVLLYTPSNEHFGICPLEGMYMECPVIAVNSGGPLETVVDGKTGFLCDPTPKAFANKMLLCFRNAGTLAEMGSAGRKHVIENFSFQAFTDKLHAIVEGLAAQRRASGATASLLASVLLLTAFCMPLIVTCIVYSKM